MFTLEQIHTEARKVKTGADFPKFINELKKIGINRSDVFVMDGMAIYYGKDNQTVETGAAYENLLISEKASSDTLKKALKSHQQGKTDYSTFCKQAAEAGVEKWIIDLNEMSVSYFAMDGKILVKENIPKV